MRLNKNNYVKKIKTDNSLREHSSVNDSEWLVQITVLISQA